MEQVEKAYWNHETAKLLSIGESTLRKWCIELEKNGYKFIKGSKDSRAFLDHDIQALTYFKQLTKNEKIHQEKAAGMVIEKYNREEANGRTPPVLPSENEQKGPDFESLFNKLIEHTQRQEEFNKALLLRLEKQEQYIKDSLEKRDRILLENIRTTQEQFAAAKEENGFIYKIKSLFSKK